MLEALLEFIGEFLLQALVEALLELGLHSLAEPFNKQANPWLAAAGYAIFGAVIGGLSLLLFPENLTPAPWRIVNLIVTPLAAGTLMATIGRWRAKRGEHLFRIDRFSYGYLFALSLALVRFAFAE